MFCNNCGTQYDVELIDNGKSKFCSNCGNLLYKNENGSNIFSQLAPIPQNDILEKQQKLEAERIRQEEILKQRQLEILQKQKEVELEQQRLFDIQRQKNIELERQRQLELERQKQAELERKKQDEFIQQQFELDKQKVAELEKQRQDEIRKQQAVILEENARIEKQLELQKQKEFEKIEAQKSIELTKQKEVELEIKQQQQIEYEILKNKSNESQIENLTIESGQKKSNKAFYFIIPILFLAILGTLAYFIFPDKINAIFNSSPTVADTSTISTTTILTNITDTALIEQIKTDLIGKEVLSWNAIKANEIKELTISSVSEVDKNSNYIVTIKLDDKAGTKAIAELVINYTKIILTSVETNKITYKNIAPVNAWFSFEPIANCNILVNTNNNPIQLKTCDNCDVQKINTNAENALQLATRPTTIYISSDTKYESEVDFTYIP